MKLVILRIAAMITPLAIALVVVLTQFLPKGDEIKTFTIWVPESGEVVNINRVEVPLDREEVIGGQVVKTGTFNDVHELSLEDFQSRNYQEVVYGIWSFDSTNVFVFYWTKDPDYPRAGVWARVHLDPGFGRARGLLSRGYYESRYPNRDWTFAYNPADGIFADFEGDTIHVQFEWDLYDGKTPILAMGPLAFYTIIAVVALMASLVMAVIPLRRSLQNRM